MCAEGSPGVTIGFSTSLYSLFLLGMSSSQSGISKRVCLPLGFSEWFFFFSDWTESGNLGLIIRKGDILFLHLLAVAFFFLRFICLLLFWLWWLFVALLRLSLVAASRGYSSLLCGLLIKVASLAAEHTVHALGLQWLQHMGSIVAACRL